MAQEIERKFLVVGDGWTSDVVRSERLVDGLLATSKGRKVRVRLYEKRATLTVKTGKKLRSRLEFEYEIPRADAEQMLKSECGRTVVGKIRHYVPVGEFMWEIDLYEPPLDGVVLAEVELSSADQDPPRPGWIGREVTEDPAFRKRQLFAEQARKRSKNAPTSERRKKRGKPKTKPASAKRST